MAKMTRLATTITARYYPTSDMTDAFFADGRLAGKRENRAADITMDKEDGGFLMAVFSHTPEFSGDASDAPAYEPILKRLHNDIKSGKRQLDDQIGDFVNTAVMVSGRMKIQAESNRSPYFAGFIVKDTEAFAITMGKGLAFLYRDDTLFPLTATDIPIEPINTQRQKVDHFYNYCASKTATALCSNIAQLKVDDCLIICNREVYDALGQKEMLRILYDAEDQCEAAGNVITEAAAKSPNVPLQFLISFVENVTVQERGGFFGLGRKKKKHDEGGSHDREDSSSTSSGAIESGATMAFSPVSPTIPVAPVVPVVPEQPVAPVFEPLLFDTDSDSKPANQPEQAAVSFVTDAQASSVPEQAPSGQGINTGSQPEAKKEDTLLDVFVDKEPASVTSKDTQTDDAGFFKVVESDQNSSVELSGSQSPSVAVENQDSKLYEAERVDEARASVQPTMSATAGSVAEETESIMNRYDHDEDEAPKFLQEDDDTNDAPLFFGDAPEEPVVPDTNDDSYVDFSSAEPEEDTSDNQNFYYDEEASVTQRPQNIAQDGGYYIPFEDTEMPIPVVGQSQDIPEMPTYAAPSYSPPSFDHSETATSPMDDSGVYARGSFVTDEENIAPSTSYSDFSANPPAFNYDTFERSASRPRPQGTQTGRPSQRPTSGRPRSGDPFDQDKGFDYGRPDSTYLRNNRLMFILAGVCFLLIIIIIVYAVKACNDDKPAKATTASTSSSAVVDTSADVTESSVDSSATSDPNVSVDPNATTVPPVVSGDSQGVFVFSENTGYRTWWDLFHTVYNINITEETDPRIATIKTYNNKPAEYVPQPGDSINLPPSSMFQ